MIEVEQLAAMERDCPECDGLGGFYLSWDAPGGDCKPCRGTGRVARVPGLREACPCEDGILGGFCDTCPNWPPKEWIGEKCAAHGCEGTIVPHWHDGCNGRGWRPVSEERAALVLLKAFGFTVGLEVEMEEEKGRWWVAESGMGWCLMHKDTPEGAVLAAAARALARAVGEGAS